MHLSEFKKKFEEDFGKAVQDFSFAADVDLNEQSESQKIKGHWYVYYEINYTPQSEAYFDSESYEEDLKPAIEALFKKLHMKIICPDEGFDFDCELEIRLPRSILDDRRCFNCGGPSKAIFCSSRCRINTKRRRDYRKNKGK